MMIVILVYSLLNLWNISLEELYNTLQLSMFDQPVTVSVRTSSFHSSSPH